MHLIASHLCQKGGVWNGFLLVRANFEKSEG